MATDWPFGLLQANAYGVIYADPPWAFRGYVSDGVPQRSKAQHYQTMLLENLKALPVGDLAKQDCALLMWSISSHTPQAFELADHWGFEFKSKVFCWAKLHPRYGEIPDHPATYTHPENDEHWHFGLGKSTRRNTEDCWLFTRGAPKQLDGGVRELVVSARREHSRKPDKVLDHIERLFSGPRCELFSRTHKPGWDVWGNEVGKFD